MKFNLLIVLILNIFSVLTQADDLDVPTDELAHESVYPVFDHPQSVKNRNVQTKSRFDVGLFGGYALTEPIFSSSKLGMAINYHFNELHSLGLVGSSNSSGLSSDGEGLKTSNNLDFNRAPKPQSTIMLDYNYKPFYGKLSLTKNGVINTTVFGSLAAGMVGYEHKSYPIIALGLGERFYFTNSLSLKMDLRLHIHQAPIPFFKSDGTSGIGTSLQAPDHSQFKERVHYITNLEIGLNYLF